MTLPDISIDLKIAPPMARRRPALGFQAAEPWSDAERPRRALNVAVAFLGLVLTAPAMFAIAALIRLTSRGPAIYAQERVGLDRRGRSRDRRLRDRGHDGRRAGDLGGRPFTIYKFRTMRTPAVADAQVWASPDDPRVTRIGRVLRKYRLDELPQLFNVVRGDMNIVGPRPEQPRIFQDLRSRIARYQDRQRVLPGITGWAQVNHHYDQSVEDVRRKVGYDLEYVARCSAVEDFKIMLRTVPVVALKKGAW